MSIDLGGEDISVDVVVVVVVGVGKRAGGVVDGEVVAFVASGGGEERGRGGGKRKGCWGPVGGGKQAVASFVVWAPSKTEWTEVSASGHLGRASVGGTFVVVVELSLIVVVERAWP